MAGEAKKLIGFSSQRIRLAWMEHAARLAREESTPAEVLEALLQHVGLDLDGKVRGKRGSREKAATILMRTWVTPPRDLEFLRTECLELLEETSDSEIQVAIHWAMLGAVYPFWLAVAGSTGRLFRLQKTVSAAQIRRRLTETYGDRELVARATRTVLRSYVDWGVLDGSGTKGIYSANPTIKLEDPRFVAPLFEALLCANPDSDMSSHDLLNHPALFAFRLDQMCPQGIADAYSHLEVYETGSG